jgi:peptide/nickel transport system permease protein
MTMLDESVADPSLPPRRGFVKVKPGSRFPILGYAVRRILAGLLTLLIVTFLIFAAIQILPGNVAEVVLGKNATPDRVAALESQLGLDQSIWSRYLAYLRDFLTGDFGYSTAAQVQGSEVSVSHVVAPALTNSLILAGIVLLVFIPLSLLLGFVSGRRAASAYDHAISTSTLAVGALPEFLIGTLLIFIFFTKLGWFPPISSMDPGTGAFENLNSMVLPVLTLLLVSMAFGSRLLRASIVDILGRDYVAVARMNGVSERRINTHYLLPNALVPSVQILAQQIQYLLGGIVIVESVFNYPGIGSELVRAISVRDVQEIMIIATILSIIYIGINIVADIVCVILDPRVRTSL